MGHGDCRQIISLMLKNANVSADEIHMDITLCNTSKLVYVNRTTSSLNRHSQCSTSTQTIPTSGAVRVIWTEAERHGMTNDWWLQFNYTLRVSLICGWLERNEAFQYSSQSEELWQYIFVIFQILHDGERTLLSLWVYPFVICLQSMPTPIVLSSDYRRLSGRGLSF